jgi:F-type H+-transporting ATPase subunit delta
MKDAHAADRYARPIFELAEAEGTSDALVHELVVLDLAMRKEPKFLLLLTNPLITRKEKHVFLEQVLGKKVNVLTKRFLMLLIEKGRVELLPVLVKKLKLLHNQKQGNLEATVVSAKPVDSALEAQLKKTLEQVTQKKILLTLETDRHFIGGAQIRIGNHLIDGTIRTKLDQLKSRLRTVKV